MIDLGSKNGVVVDVVGGENAGAGPVAVKLDEVTGADVTPANDTTGRKLRFLRRIPYDPMTRSTDWGLRSSRDNPDSRSWGGQNVFDVYTKFDGKALDGTSYRDDW